MLPVSSGVTTVESTGVCIVLDDVGCVTVVSVDVNGVSNVSSCVSSGVTSCCIKSSVLSIDVEIASACVSGVTVESDCVCTPSISCSCVSGVCESIFDVSGVCESSF